MLYTAVAKTALLANMSLTNTYYSGVPLTEQPLRAGQDETRAGTVIVIAVFTEGGKCQTLFSAKIADQIHAARGVPRQNRVHYYYGASWGFM